MKKQIIKKKRRWKFLAGSVAGLLIVAVSTYGTWGYERHLAIESEILIPEMVDPTYQFAIAYQKRFRFLPGSPARIVAVTRREVEEIRSDAFSAYDWSLPEVAGTTYAYTADFTPQPGMTKHKLDD